MDDVHVESEDTSTYFAPKPVMVLLTMLLLIGICAIFGNGLLMEFAPRHTALSKDAESAVCKVKKMLIG